MKCLKMASLAAIAAAALTMFLGAATASATVLCTTAADPCVEGWRWPAGTEIIASMEVGTSTKETEPEPFEATRDTCIESSISGDQEIEGSATETVTIENILVLRSNCTKSGIGYWQEALEIHWIPGTNDGTVTSAGEALTTMPFLGGSCTYAGTDIGTLTGGKPATLKMEVVLKKTGGTGLVCPMSLPRWDAVYAITEPTPLFVTEG